MKWLDEYERPGAPVSQGLASDVISSFGAGGIPQTDGGIRQMVDEVALPDAPSHPTIGRVLGQPDVAGSIKDPIGRATMGPVSAREHTPDDGLGFMGTLGIINMGAGIGSQIASFLMRPKKKKPKANIPTSGGNPFR